MGHLPVSYSTLLFIHAGATLLMTGVIWVIQLVHYPLFALVGEDGYSLYQGQHMKRITWVVGPLMLTEVSCATLIYTEASVRHSQLAFIGAMLLAVIWLSTAVLQVPAHNKLTQAWDSYAHRKLVWSNWIRTIAWSARGVVALTLLQ